MVTLSFNLAPDASLGDAVKAVNQVKDEMGMPSSIQAAYQGTAEAFQTSLANEPVLIAAALITVYLVLGILYESYIHPLTILSALPSAGVGALLALILFHQDFSVIALIGIVLLIGIVKKNAIMMMQVFRSRGGTRRGYEAGGRYLPGMLAALPSYYDDHHGGAAGRGTVGSRFRKWLRTAAALGSYDHRRPAHQPAFDALHNTGDLHLV